MQLTVRALYFGQDYGMNKIFCPVFSRAGSAIAFSWLHPEATKEINQVNPVNPV
jgi:hypothetical protein